MYRGIANKVMKKDKKMTMLNIISVAIAMILFTNIIYIYITKSEFQAESRRESVGDYSVVFHNADKELANNLINSVEVKNFGIGEINSMPDLMLIKLSNELEDMLKSTITPIEGGMPQNENEVILDNAALYKSDKKVGDTINLNGKEYVIVGSIQNTPFLNMGKIALTKGSQEIKADTKYEVYLTFKDEKNQKDEIIKLAERNNLTVDNDGTSLSFNTPYIESFQGITSSTEVAVNLVLLLVVIISLIVVIYNSFNMSISGRVKNLGIIASLGATSNQIRKIIYREALWIGVIGSIIGAVGSIITMVIFTNIVGSKIEGFSNININLNLIMFIKISCMSAILTLITVFISVLRPARLASKISPVTAVSGIGISIKDNLTIKTPMFVKSIFGDIGVLAYKNIKRYKGRFRFNIVSLSLTIILAMIFVTFVESARQNGEFDIRESFYQTQIYGNISDEDLEVLKNMDDVKMYSTKSVGGSIIPLEKNQFSEEYINSIFGKIDKVEDTKYYRGYSDIFTYNDLALEMLTENLIEGTTDPRELEQNGIIVIDQRDGIRTTTFNIGDTVRIPKLSYYGGDSKDLNFHNEVMSTIANEDFYQFKVIGIVSETIDKSYFNDFGVIVSNSAFENLDTINKNTSMYLKFDTIEQDKGIYDKIGKKIIASGGVYYSKYQEQELMDKRLISINTIGYSFIGMIALISLVNIINTAAVNILSRKREIAILKSLGMTTKDVKKMILVENLILAFWSMIIGGIVGAMISVGMISRFNDLMEAPVVMPIFKLLIIPFLCLATLLIIYIVNMNRWSKVDIKETLAEN
ncbi:MAG: FtsX-like permease family protein [Clostridium sp.]